MLVKQHFYDIAGKDSMVDSYIPKNVSQNRIPRFASQNSYHGQPSVLGLFLEDKGSKLLIS